MRLPSRVRTLLLVSFGILSACSLAKQERNVMEGPTAGPADPAVAHAAPPAALQRQLLRTVTLDLEVESIAQARKAAEALTSAAGGFVEGLDGSEIAGMQQLQLTLRIPQTGLDAALAQARKLGTATHESQQVEDVTRKVVDADARLRNMHQTEERLRTLLAMPQSGLADVLAVERELSRVREESEVLDAELRALKEQVALSTLKLSLVQEADAAAPPSVWTPWRRLGRNVGGILAESAGALLGLGAMLVTSVLYALPWSPLLVLLWLAVRRMRGRRR